MTTAPFFLPTPYWLSSLLDVRPLLLIGVLSITFAGCHRPAPIETYKIPTKLPEQLRPGNERMLAAMFPKGDNVWFFKVSGPEEAVGEIDTTFREFVEKLEFSDDQPDLSKLPEGWRRGADREFRFASIAVDTPSKQLDVSVSQLPRQGEWDEQVKMNVNRWRGQLSLKPSEEKWAAGEALEIAAADTAGIWVDLLGEAGAPAAAMTPPFAGSSPSQSMGAGAMGAGAATSMPDRKPAGDRAADSTQDSNRAPAEPDPRLKFERPDGWRDGRMSTMRMAAFEVGPEGETAELTVIPAGGDLRGNVARWLGQVRGENVPDEVVDKALADAQQIEVDGRPAQRFLLFGKDDKTGDAIDATIVPIDGGISLFVKMTGPAQTVSQETESIASFLKSLKLSL